jgi:hypothetical protein
MRRSLPNWLMKDLVPGMAFDIFKEQSRAAWRISRETRSVILGVRRNSGSNFRGCASVIAVLFQGPLIHFLAQIVVGLGAMCS